MSLSLLSHLLRLVRVALPPILEAVERGATPDPQAIATQVTADLATHGIAMVSPATVRAFVVALTGLALDVEAARRAAPPTPPAPDLMGALRDRMDR